MTEEIVMLIDPGMTPEDELALAWRRHRIRQGRIPTSADETREAMLGPSISGMDPVRHGYFELVVTAAPVVLEAEIAGEDPLPALLLASGAVS